MEALKNIGLFIVYLVVFAIQSCMIYTVGRDIHIGIAWVCRRIRKRWEWRRKP